MKRNRWLALLFLVFALVAMLAAGLYLGVTHQEARPVDNGSPDSAVPAR